MPIESIKIPQNVYIEDHIVGPLTLKQLIISAIGCGFSYALYSILAKTMSGAVPLPVTILVWIPGVISIIFAFVKINDLSMLHILLLLIEKANKPSVRTWQPRRGITINIRTVSATKKNETPQGEEHVKNVSGIEELSTVLDKPYTTAPVDPSRISVTPLTEDASMDISPMPITPMQASEQNDTKLPIFRDLSPRLQ